MKTMVGRAPDGERSVEVESFRPGAFEQETPIRASASSSKTNGRRREIIILPWSWRKKVYRKATRKAVKSPCPAMFLDGLDSQGVTVGLTDFAGKLARKSNPAPSRKAQRKGVTEI
jgi:hypothetical protein